MEVSPKGGKWWRFKYCFNGKDKRISLGVWPDITLQTARIKRDECRSFLVQSIDPGEQRKEAKRQKQFKEKNSFKAITEEWHQKNYSKWTPRYAQYTLRRMEKDIFPVIGKMPIADIKTKDVLGAVRRIEERKAFETAHRIMGVCVQVFRYAVTMGIIEHNPAVDLQGVLAPIPRKHFASVTDPKDVAKILRMLDAYDGGPVVSCALRLAPLVFVRPGELIAAKWNDIDFEKEEWRYLVTKTKTPHIVPLSRQAVKILKDVHSLTMCANNMM